MTGAHARWSRAGILFIVLLAFGLRLFAIDRQDIWGDEAFSIWLSSQPLADVVAGGADTHPPLYPFLLFLWLRLAGSSPLAVRLLSAFVGTLTVPVLYALGRRAWPAVDPTGERRGRWPAALLAALLAAVSPVLVYYSQETRMYGLVALFSAASVYWAIRTWQKPRSVLAGLAYLLTTLAAAYTHYYAFFVILAENLVLVVSMLRRRTWSSLGRWLAVQGALALAYIPWVLVQTGFLSGKASARFEEWDLSTARRIAGETLGSFSAGLAVPATASRLVSVLFGIVIVAGLWVVIRRRRVEPWLVVAYLLAPLFLAWVVNPIMPFFYARYLLLIAPAFYVLAAWGAMAAARLWRPLGVVCAVILLAASGYGLHGYYTDEAYAKGGYGQMMAYVETNAQPGDGLVLANQLQRPIFEYYQPAGFEGQTYLFPQYGIPLEDPRTVEELASIASSHPRLWLVRFGNPAEYDPDGFLIRWLATHGSKAYYGGWGDADLSLYVTAPAASDASIQHPLRADLGGQVRLLGYALSAEQVAPGDTLLLTLYWQALEPMDVGYTVFTHLLDAEAKIQAQMDSEPQGGGLPTDRWSVGETVQDNYALAVPAGAEPGPHTLEVGMYLLETLDRLPVTDSATGSLLGDRVLLGSVEVSAP